MSIVLRVFILLEIDMKLITFLLCTATLVVNGQVADDSELFEALKTNDSLLFEQGFNNCNLAAFEFLLADDLEFYHDQGGITNSKAEFIVTYKKNICGNPDYRSRRELLTASLEVFPLYDNGKLYGAIQKGVHKFYEKPKNKPEIEGSTARFTHLWLLDQGQWILKRVLSYDHYVKQ